MNGTGYFGLVTAASFVTDHTMKELDLLAAKWKTRQPKTVQVVKPLY